MTFEEAAATVRAERDNWINYQDAQADYDILKRMHDRNPVAATVEEVEQAKKKSAQLLAAWSDSRKAARAALDEVLQPFQLARADLISLVS